MASFSVPGRAPSSKEKKYDRQLRLWGANGQNRLESSHIALVGSTATGCEVLKNLVLPGIGQFTVIDDKIVEEADLGVNFFLEEGSVGKPRAERTAALLGELNPDVKGNYIIDNIQTLLSTKPELFNPPTSPFSHLLLISPVPTSLLLQLPPEMPTFLVNSFGFTTSLRISASTHTIVETHPDSLVDLRLLNPWPELSALAAEKTRNLDLRESEGGMSDHEHGHVPYLLLLLKYLEDWKQSHGGHVPESYSEKGEFKALVMDGMRVDVPGGSEENYEEATAAVLKNLRQAEVSSGTREVFGDPESGGLTPESENFWVLAKAVKEFMLRPDQGNGLLPLSGGVPDMKAESHGYVELQNLYRTKARGDAYAVGENVRAILSSLGRDPRSIGDEEVDLFCRHSNFIRRLNYRPFTLEFSASPDEHHRKAVAGALQSWDSETSLIHDYVALRAYQEFVSQNNSRAPGDTDDSGAEEDFKEMVRLAKEYLSSLGITCGLGERCQKIIKEIVRAGGGELHVVASLAGGIVAQEVIKVITKQYVPANNTVIFDGVGSRTQTFEL